MQAKAGAQLQELYQKAVQEVGESGAMIFEVHQMMLEDQDYLDSITNMISSQQINAEYAVAAKIDGASNGQVLIRIVMPLIKNLFFTILLINFVEFWNNYQTPKVYLPYYPTLGYTLFYYANSNNFSDATQVIALAFIVATPVLLLFLIFQERLSYKITHPLRAWNDGQVLIVSKQ